MVAYGPEQGYVESRFRLPLAREGIHAASCWFASEVADGVELTIDSVEHLFRLMIDHTGGTKHVKEMQGAPYHSLMAHVWSTKAVLLLAEPAPARRAEIAHESFSPPDAMDFMRHGQAIFESLLGCFGSVEARIGEVLLLVGRTDEALAYCDPALLRMLATGASTGWGAGG